MDEMQINKLRSEFKNILYQHSTPHFSSIQDNTIYDYMYESFEGIYGGYIYKLGKKIRCDFKFKHYQSDIFSVLLDIEKNNARNGDIAILYSQIGDFLHYAGGNNLYNQDIIKEVRKLYDHIELEIDRIKFIFSSIKENNNINTEIFNKEIDNIINKLDSDKIEIYKTLETKTQNYQKEYVSILGIFSGVAVAFISGITLSSSIFQNIHNLNIWVGLSAISLLGMVLSNVLLILLSFILKIIDHKSTFIKSSYYMVFNILMLIILIISLVMYFINLN